MKSIILLILVCACALASETILLHRKNVINKSYRGLDDSISSSSAEYSSEVYSEDSTPLLMTKQQLILDLLKFINTDYYNYKKYSQIIEKFNLYDFATEMCVTMPVLLRNDFIKYYNTNLWVQRTAEFNLFDKYHREQAIGLFKIFYYTKDWETLKTIMIWSRYNVNPRLFVYALQSAILHREDFIGIVFPTIYEIFPNYYVNSDVIEEAQQLTMTNFMNVKRFDNNMIMIERNLTELYATSNIGVMDENEKLKYFTEDIGLNAQRYNYYLMYPFWMDGKEFGLNKDRRGEFFLFIHQQLLARYNMERASNGLDEIEPLTFYPTIDSGYQTNLRYYNGQLFKSRDNNYNVYNQNNLYYIEFLADYERRMRDAIDFGYIMLPDGTRIDLTKPESIESLGNYIQGNPDCKFKHLYNYMEIFTKLIYGYDISNVGVRNYVPGILSHYDTQLRDPIYYKLWKRIINYYYKFYDHLPSYTYDDVKFDGVSIENVVIDPLYTYFDRDEIDITNAVELNPESDIIIKYRPYRLNHKGFNVRININSKIQTKAVVKLFYGPKYNVIDDRFVDVNELRKNLFEVDQYTVDLIAGENMIVRHCDEFRRYYKQFTSFYELYKTVMTTSSENLNYAMNMNTEFLKRPYRLMLPKGTINGMPIQFYVVVIPYYPAKLELHTTYDYTKTSGVGSGSRYVDALPLGYPFNRKIDPTVMFVDNIYVYDTEIYHLNAVNTPQYFDSINTMTSKVTPRRAFVTERNF